MKKVLLIHVVLSLLRCACGQNEEASILLCGEDNYSCSNLNPDESPICLTLDQLCNNVTDCVGGDDEGSSSTLNSLDCKLFICLVRANA